MVRAGIRVLLLPSLLFSSAESALGHLCVQVQAHRMGRRRSSGQAVPAWQGGGRFATSLSWVRKAHGDPWPSGGWEVQTLASWPGGGAALRVPLAAGRLCPSRVGVFRGFRSSPQARELGRDKTAQFRSKPVFSSSSPPVRVLTQLISA